jgi:hypothetical protein
MKFKYVIIAAMIAQSATALGQPLRSRCRKPINLNIRMERREVVVKGLFLGALVSMVVLHYTHPTKTMVNFGIPAGVALGTLSYATIADIERKPKRR